MAAPESCPNCGADVPREAKSCPDCGSDEKTGWSEEAQAQGLDLPDQEFNYDEFVDKEFGRPKKSKKQILWWLVAVGLLIWFVLLLLPH